MSQLSNYVMLFIRCNTLVLSLFYIINKNIWIFLLAGLYILNKIILIIIILVYHLSVCNIDFVKLSIFKNIQLLQK